MGHLIRHGGLSVRRACRLVGLRRTTAQYRPRRPADAAVRARLRALAEQRGRFGYRRLHVLLRREGWRVNHKRVERLYREERLSLRLRRRRKHAAVLRVPLPRPQRPNQHWAMDFMADALNSGRRLRILTLVDTYSRECPAIEVDTSLPGPRVVQVLERLVAARGRPEAIRVDNGPECIGNALDAWAYQQGITLDPIRPGKPRENAYIESFNGRVRDECLNAHWFATLQEAREIIEAWRIDDNRCRPHSALGNLAPEEFLRKDQEVTAVSTTGRLTL